MDLTTLLESRGESLVLTTGGALIGLVFGFAAQRSRFCARAAVVECCQGRVGGRLAVWLLAFAFGLLSVQLLVAMGWVEPAASRFIGQSGSLSGALVGGLLFGAGMILTRGCASRLLILSANGNLRALLAGLIFAVTVQATMGGWLAPLRQWMSAWWPLDAGPSRNMILALGLSPWVGAALAAALLLLAVAMFARHHPRRFGLALGALACGGAIAAGWFFTQAVARSSFEPVAVQSLSYSGPSAEWLMRVLSTTTAPRYGFDAGLLPATFIGSLIGALIGREFRFEGFKTENKLGHYMLGAVLMGFGAVLAGGCTVGAGMSGGALFALTAWLTLGAIAAGAALTWRLHQRLGWAT